MILWAEKIAHPTWLNIVKHRMKTLPSIPIFIALVQIFALIHLYITYENEHAHIPVAFIELNILSIFNALFVFIFIYFYIKNKFSLSFFGGYRFYCHYSLY